MEIRLVLSFAIEGSWMVRLTWINDCGKPCSVIITSMNNSSGIEGITYLQIRYDAVFHLVSCAVGAEKHYNQN
jgi:hypothetical protein